MRMHELFEDTQDVMRFNRAWNIWMQAAGSRNFTSAEQAKIKQTAQDAVSRGAEPADAIGVGVELVRQARQNTGTKPSTKPSTNQQSQTPSAPQAKKAKPSFSSSNVDLEFDVELPGPLQWAKDKFVAGTKIGDKYTKVTKK